MARVPSFFWYSSMIPAKEDRSEPVSTAPGCRTTGSYQHQRAANTRIPPDTTQQHRRATEPVPTSPRTRRVVPQQKPLQLHVCEGVGALLAALPFARDATREACSSLPKWSRRPLSRRFPFGSSAQVLRRMSSLGLCPCCERKIQKLVQC